MNNLNWKQWVAITLFLIIALLATFICACHQSWDMKTAGILTVILVYAFYDRTGIWRAISEKLRDE